MKSTTIFIISSFLALAAAQYNISSESFYLEIKSDNDTLNGAALFSCHEGAAIESLCFLNDKNTSDWETYTFNTSYYYGDTQTVNEPGILSWILPATPDYVPSALTLSTINYASNVGVPLFLPGTESPVSVAFDENNLLNIQSSLDDTVYPFNLSGVATSYYRWYICETYVGYTENTLSWVFGEYPAQNPTCQAVNITRVFTC